ncbi:MAG TPA: metallophosphoesterase, partial [Tepidisphaeraceae bacterium]|nr:metallophosphoesterase [Tepidisphaeraceae bacterium]
MIDSFVRYLRNAHWERQTGWRRAIWQTANRVGLTGIHALPMHQAWVEIHERPMPLPNLDADHHGLRLVQISDLHYSPFVWSGYLRQHLRFVNDLKPDLIVITGDLISGGYRWLDRVARLLSHLEAPRGVICTLGNHDYSMWGKLSLREGRRRADRLERSLNDNGLRVLRNEVFTLAGNNGGKPLAIVGLDDEWTGHLDAPRAFNGIDPDQPTICLNHNPANARDLLDYPWQWMLAGHTHGRAIATTRVGRFLYPKRFRHFTHGYYAVEGR